MDINCFKFNNPTQYLQQPILFICYISHSDLHIDATKVSNKF